MARSSAHGARPKAAGGISTRIFGWAGACPLLCSAPRCPSSGGFRVAQSRQGTQRGALSFGRVPFEPLSAADAKTEIHRHAQCGTNRPDRAQASTLQAPLSNHHQLADISPPSQTRVCCARRRMLLCGYQVSSGRTKTRLVQTLRLSEVARRAR